MFSSCDVKRNDDAIQEIEKVRADFLKQLGTDTMAIRQYLGENNLLTEAKSTKTGLFQIVLTPGNGIQPNSGYTVNTHYVLRRLNGDVLQSSYEARNGVVQSFPFNLNLNNVNPITDYPSPIYGYQQGVYMMKVGGKSRFILPSGLAYKAFGNPAGKIAPNEILIFDIELLSANPQ
ncbi:FKBP-type peptidyl-prolyl cis-trans isomerase [Adhaeribacter aquaticus]|uniref:FKBP-type peptidyl-prolyl cis-trans isomerase n=1 Tax=Adhaeribacter aquaticus TaxID=299567 RepID=UPI00146FA207|nr:FKBP-type peptidyl-prolyl cis-trans isomerase [Adhaeribacter aquaticus]